MPAPSIAVQYLPSEWRSTVNTWPRKAQQAAWSHWWTCNWAFWSFIMSYFQFWNKSWCEWVSLPESGSKTLASCSLEAIYLLYLECPSNAQDLVPLGSKKTRIEFMKFADSGRYLCLIHWRCLSWVAQGSEVNWVNCLQWKCGSIEFTWLFVFRNHIKKKPPSDILKYVLSSSQKKVREWLTCTAVCFAWMCC